MKKYLLAALYLLFISSPIWGQVQTNIENVLCESDYTVRRTISPWKKDSGGFDHDSDGLCAKVFCANDKKEITRQKCFKQDGEFSNNVIVSYQDEIHEKNSMLSHGFVQDVRIQEGELCYSECLPVPKKLLGMKIKIESGLDRESCRNCFSTRKDLNFDGSFFYKEIGKKIYPGQKCFKLCQDPKGPIGTSHNLSLECRACTGATGLMSEVFHYLLTKDNNCFEIDNENVLRIVPNLLCTTSQSLEKTDFKIVNIGFLFTKRESCVEYDKKTNGQAYKREVALENCKTDSIVDSDRSINEKETVTDPKRNSFKETSASEQ